MRPLLFALLGALTASALSAQVETLPYSESDPAYHEATIALAEYCVESELYSEAAKLCRGVKGQQSARAAEILEDCKDSQDAYTAETWGDYLDRREAVQKRRAAGALEAGVNPRNVRYIDPDNETANEALGMIWLGGMGWLQKTEHERFAPLTLVMQDEPAKPDREVSWEAPYVLVGEHFTLVTDLSWKRAIKYSGLLDRFHGIFLETLGDFIPPRDQPNVVWCCKDAETFVAFSKSIGMPMTENHSGMHVSTIGAVLINAERSDYVGRKNKSDDNLARTLYHECAHRLVDIGLRGRVGGSAAWAMAGTTEHAWIVESIAIVFEGLSIKKKKHTLKELEDQRMFIIGDWQKRKTGAPELEPIFKQGRAAFAEGKPISSAEKYALAGSVGWYCLFAKPDEYRNAYLTLLVDYYRTDTSHSEFARRFGLSLKDFQGEWREWVMDLK